VAPADIWDPCCADATGMVGAPANRVGGQAPTVAIQPAQTGQAAGEMAHDVELPAVAAETPAATSRENAATLREKGDTLQEATETLRENAATLREKATPVATVGGMAMPTLQCSATDTGTAGVHCNASLRAQPMLDVLHASAARQPYGGTPCCCCVAGLRSRRAAVEPLRPPCMWEQAPCMWWAAAIEPPEPLQRMWRCVCRCVMEFVFHADVCMCR
jgi:hypothetical protein